MSAISRAPKLGEIIVALGCLVAWSPSAFALDPSLDISQYAHTAWKSREGFFNGAVQAIAQTPDGYLWLGTEFGLFRFDGVRSVPWQSPTGEQLPNSLITRLLAAPDGTLWIGTLRGLASWKDGQLIQYHELDGQSIGALLQDREGTVWVGTWGTPTGSLCEIQGTRVSCHGEDGSFGLGVLSLCQDSSGNLWAGAETGLWRWAPGPPTPYPTSEREIRDLIEGDHGEILISMPGGIRQFRDGNVEPYLLSASWPQFKPESLLRDRDGGLWIGTQDRGLFHLHQGRLDVFSRTDGLSSDRTNGLPFEDREGTIWIPTANGIDRFRNFAAATISVRQGLSEAIVGSVLSAKDGSVWLGTPSGLYRLNNGQLTLYRKRGDRLTHAVEPSLVREVVDSGVPDNVGSLFQDDQGRIWVFSSSGVAYFETDRFTPVSSVPGGYVHSVVGDKAGDLWISDQDHGLYHLIGQNLIEQIPWAQLGRTDFAYALSTDPVRGGVWLGFYQGGLAYFRDGQIRASYQVADGLGKGTVNDLRLDGDGTLWVATEGGLSRVRNGRVATLTSLNGLPCDAVNWVVEDDSHAFWLSMPCGLVRIGQSDLHAWDNDPGRSVRTAVFGGSDGVRSSQLRDGFSPQVAKTADGKLWFLAGDGVSVIDPRHLTRNEIPPPVHVEQITADRKTYDTSSDVNGHVRLPPLIRDLEIDYTALSLVSPEKNQFRYKLEDHDADWQDVGTRRQAFYNDLAPGNYRFRVVASNNSGVWNEQGAALDFSIAPAYWQTLWFRAACMAAFLLVLWALYRLRLRQIEALRQAHDELARINRVTTMGELTASLAHEISQPISGTMTNANTCLRKLGSDKPDLDEVRTAVARIARDAQRAAEIIGRIRSQFKKGAMNREVIDVNEINRDTVALLRGEAGRYNISVHTELAADLPQIVGDRVQLQQVAMNLIVNSIEAMKEVDGIREIVIKSRRAEDEQILISVSDTGIGFPPELAEQIFAPFFTTKAQGTGMGLRISRTIIESHGGRLWAVGTPGRGATFHLSLPGARQVKKIQTYGQS